MGRSNVLYSPDVTALKRYGNNRLVVFCDNKSEERNRRSLFVHFSIQKNFMFMLATCFYSYDLVLT